MRDIYELGVRLDKLADNVRETVPNPFAREFVKEADKDTALISSAIKDGTGALVSSLEPNVSFTRTGVHCTYGSPLKVQSGTGASYYLLELLDKGTRPHLIFPRNASMLVFRVYDKSARGRKVVTDMVSHPGIKGFAVLENSDRYLKEKAKQCASEGFREAWRKAGI